jgi:hypothetical protein
MALLTAALAFLVAFPVGAQERLRQSAHFRASQAYESALATAQSVPGAKLPEGTYLAFDSDVREAFLGASCDDDGDHVVVVSEAMLTLVERVARAVHAQTSPEDALRAQTRLVAYATVLIKASADRPLPPPLRDFYPETRNAASDWTKTEHAMLVSLILPEVLRVQNAGLACSNPTETREAGDSEWTANERAAMFLRMASSLYALRSQEAQTLAKTMLQELTPDSPSAPLEQFFTLAGKAPALLRHRVSHPAPPAPDPKDATTKAAKEPAKPPAKPPVAEKQQEAPTSIAAKMAKLRAQLGQKDRAR